MTMLVTALLLGGALRMSNPTAPLPPRREFALPDGPAALATSSPDGRLLALSGASMKIAIFQIRTGLPLRAYVGHQRPVAAMVFSASRDTILSADAGGEIRLWNAETLTTLGMWRVPGVPAAVRITPDGRTALVVLTTGDIWRWNLRKPATDAEHLPLKPFPAGTRVTSVSLHPAGSRMALGLASGTVATVDLGTSSIQLTPLFQQPITSVFFAADSVVAAANTPEIAVWHPDQPATALSSIARVPLLKAISGLTADPSAPRLAFSSATGGPAIFYPAERRTEYPTTSVVPTHYAWFEPLDNLLLALGTDGRVRSWKLDLAQ